MVSYSSTYLTWELLATDICTLYKRLFDVNYFIVDIARSETETLKEAARPTSTHNWGWCTDWCGEAQSAAQKLKVLY